MNSVYKHVKHSSMAAIVLAVLVVWFAGMAIPAQAQEHPAAFFPYPSTFQINGVVNYGDLLGVQAAVAGDFNGDGKLDIVSVAGGAWEIDVALGNGDGTFQAPIVNTYSFGSNNAPYALAVGDFNGDGKLDLAVWGNTSAGNEAVWVFLGNGNGTFSYSNIYVAPNSNNWVPNTNSIYVADFNGDGKLDIAAVGLWCSINSSNNSCVYIYLGNGDGTFQTGVPYSTVDPNYPNDYNVGGMAVGDLKGNGKPDIAVTENNGMAVLLNNGDGTFGTATYYDDGINQSSEIGIAIGDVNGDKKNDIVITSYRYGDLILYLNQGGGKFALKGSVGQAPGQGASWLVSMADINGDKKLDLVVSDNAGEIWTFYGKGDGTFTAGPVYPYQNPQATGPDNFILADFNGDGVLDIFKPLESHSWDGEVILGRSDGTFQTNAANGWNENGWGYNLVTSDFNGDGIPDVAYSGAYNSGVTEAGFEVMLGSSHGVLGTPTFVEVATGCGYNVQEWIAVGDVNGDGKPDIVATGASSCMNNQAAVVTGKGNGKFNKPVYYSTGTTALSYDVFLEDVNGDGKPDIVISNADGTISILLNKGNGKFKTAKLITSITQYNSHLNSLAFGDFNGDGKLDIAVGTYGQQSAVYVLLGNGDGTFQAPVSTNVGQYIYSDTLAAADFNKDGKLDLLVTLAGNTGAGCYSGEIYALLQGNGDGTFAVQPWNSSNCLAGFRPDYPVVADFNGDGNLDAFISLRETTSTDPYGPAVLEGNGDGTFKDLGESEWQYWQGNYEDVFKGGFYVGTQSNGAVVADFNGDGTPDIAVLNNDIYYNVDYISFVTVMFNNTLPVSVSPLNLNFGTVAIGSHKKETVLVTNDQTTSLQIKSVTLGGADPGDFSETSSCGKALKAGFECTIKVTFTPTTAGQRTATLSIKDSVGTQVVQLSGTGQ